MGIEFKHSAAADAILLLDKLLFRRDVGFLPDSLREILADPRLTDALADVAEGRPISRAVASLAARIVGPGGLATRAARDLPDVLKVARTFGGRAGARTGSSLSRESASWAAYTVASHQGVFTAFLDALISKGFDEWWVEVALPVLTAAAGDLQRSVGNIDFEHAWFLTRKLSPRDLPPVVWVYLSYCRPPVDFFITESEVVLDGVDAGEGRSALRSVLHGLLRPLAGPKLVAAYEVAARSDPYLKSLSKPENGSPPVAPEKTLVTPAVLYVAYKAGLYTLEEAFAELDGLYGNRVPLAVIILDLMLRSDGLILDYEGWLLSRFADGTFRIGAIAVQVDEIIPEYSERAG